MYLHRWIQDEGSPHMEICRREIAASHRIQFRIHLLESAAWQRVVDNKVLDFLSEAFESWLQLRKVEIN